MNNWCVILRGMIKLKAFWLLLRTKIKYIIKVKILKLQKRRLIKADYLENPMLKYPRNNNCWCGSHLKAKKCCLPKQAKALPADMTKPLKMYVKEIRSK